MTKNRRSKAGGRKLKLVTFFAICKRLLVPRPNFWSQATSRDHVGIQHGKLMWHKNQPGPIQCFIWAEPNNSAFYMFFLINFGQLYGPGPTIRAFNFWATTYYNQFIFCSLGLFCSPFKFHNSAFLQFILFIFKN